MTSAKRRAALEEFDRALGSYLGAAEYLDQQRVVERRKDALEHESPHRALDSTAVLPLGITAGSTALEHRHIGAERRLIALHV